MWVSRRRAKAACHDHGRPESVSGFYGPLSDAVAQGEWADLFPEGGCDMSHGDEMLAYTALTILIVLILAALAIGSGI